MRPIFKRACKVNFHILLISRKINIPINWWNYKWYDSKMNSLRWTGSSSCILESRAAPRQRGQNLSGFTALSQTLECEPGQNSQVFESWLVHCLSLLFIAFYIWDRIFFLLLSSLVNQCHLFYLPLSKRLWHQPFGLLDQQTDIYYTWFPCVASYCLHFSLFLSSVDENQGPETLGGASF